MVKRSTTPGASGPVMRERAPLSRPGPMASPTRSRAEPALSRPGARVVAAPRGSSSLLMPPGLRDAPELDLMCSHFVLSIVTRLGPRFNLRRDLQSLLSLVGRHLVWPPAVLRRLRAFLEQRCQDHDGWQGQASLSLTAFIEQYGTWQGPFEEDTLFFHLDEYARESPKDVLTVLVTTVEWLGHTLRQRPHLLQRNIDTLADLLQLSRGDQALLLYGTLARYQRELRNLLVEFKVHNAPEAYGLLADVAGVDAGEIRDGLRAGSRLERIGLVDNLLSEHNITDMADLMKVSERLPPVLMREYRSHNELMAVFTRPASASALSLGDFSFVQEDAQLLCDLLRESVARREGGINVLIYGPPGTGKTELAKVVAREAGLELFEVEYADREGHSLSGRDRCRSMQIAQVFLKGTARSALLFDEVEDVFPALPEVAGRAPRMDSTPMGQSGGKAWVNQVLESNPVPTLWVTNRIDQIDPAFRRRFAYHLELKSPPPGAREQLIRRAVEGQPVSEALVARLTERPGLTPAQIHTAVRFARLVSPPDGRPDANTFDGLIERQLRQADQALGRRTAQERRDGVFAYGLEWLNTESRHELPRMIAALRAKGHGSLCFHGPPGTGKTALAEHLAQAMERPLMIRRASDLMSKFVGETEQQIAAMFAEAEAEQAVLLLDEADSFLLDRKGAQRQHEVSEVNEMLQGMERFRGIFVCTTNLMDRIDPAALRRFTFKIRFHPLAVEQRLALFAQLVLGATDASATTLKPEWASRLRQMDQLCPGDFAAVQRQADLLGEAPDADAFLSQLEAEHRLKPEVRERRTMGFTG